MSWWSGDDVATMRRRRTPTPEDPNDNQSKEDDRHNKSHVITTWPYDPKLEEDPQLLIDLMMEEMRVEAEIERMRLILKEEEGNQSIFAECQLVIALFSLPPILIYLAVYVFLFSS